MLQKVQTAEYHRQISVSIHLNLEINLLQPSMSSFTYLPLMAFCHCLAICLEGTQDEFETIENQGAAV